MVIKVLQGRKKSVQGPIRSKRHQVPENNLECHLQNILRETHKLWRISQIHQETKAARAFGNAVGQNPINIIIPCNRVVWTNGGIGGFGGGLNCKRFLLNIEGILPSNGSSAEKGIDLRTFF